MTKKDELLEAAEQRVRTGGYDNFSFRDLANDVGIKSASVHYHFPTKAKLGAELVKRYTQRFLENLGEPQNPNGKHANPIQAYIDMFRTALLVEKQMCLCGLLGAESDGLPEEVKFETKTFFERNLEWLEKAFDLTKSNSTLESRVEAERLLCALEGAMLISKSMDNIAIFNNVVAPYLSIPD